MNIAKIIVNQQSSIRIDAVNKLYFDPFNLKDEPHNADIVFVTHEHYDHFSPKDILKAANEKTIFVVPQSMKDVFRKKCDVPIERIYPMVGGQTALIVGVPIQAVSAYNLNKPFHPKKNGWLSCLNRT